MPEPVAHVDPAMNGHAVPDLAESLQQIRERARRDVAGGSDPTFALLNASLRTATNIVARGTFSTLEAAEFLRDVARSELGLDPRSAGVTQTIERHLEHRPRLCGDAEQDHTGLPSIKVKDGRHLREHTTDALAAAVSANRRSPRIFVSGGELCRIKQTDEGRWVRERLGTHAARGELDRAMNFVAKTKNGWTPVPPPMEVVQDVLSLAEWSGIPPLDGIVTSPRVRPGGSILQRPGYDPATRLFLAYGGEPIDVPEYPTQNDAREAARFIGEEMLGDFPFVGPAGLANTMGFGLSIFTRPAIAGSVPVAAFDARSGQGTGKTLVARSICVVAGGTEPAMSAVPGDEEEWRKSLTAFLMRGGDVLIYDNVTQPVESGAFANAITSPLYEDRVLGASRKIELPVRCCWAVNGNRLIFGDDMARRVYAIELDAKCARPEDREGFRHPDLMRFVRENRPALARAFLVMARAWWVAGCPAPKLKTWGSFEDFVRVVGGILEYAGVTGFLANRQEFRDAANESRHEWSAFLAALHSRFGDRTFTTKQVVDEAEMRAVVNGESVPGGLAATLPGDLHDAYERKRGFAHRLGHALAKWSGRIIDEFQLEDAGRNTNTKSRQFRVVMAGTGPAAPSLAGFAEICGDVPNPPHARDSLFTGYRLETSPQNPRNPANGSEQTR